MVSDTNGVKHILGEYRIYPKVFTAVGLGANQRNQLHLVLIESHDPPNLTHRRYLYRLKRLISAPSIQPMVQALEVYY